MSKLSRVRRSVTLWVFVSVWSVCVTARADFSIQQIADPDFLNRDVVVSASGVVAWIGTSIHGSTARSSLFVHQGGEKRALVDDAAARAHGRPYAKGDRITWTSHPRDSGEKQTPRLVDPIRSDSPRHEDEQTDTENAERAPEHTADLAASAQQDRSAASVNQLQSDTGTSEIMLWDGDQVTRLTVNNIDDRSPVVDGELVAWQAARGWPFGWEIMAWANGTYIQLTTNLHYDMGPQVSGDQVAWYGWDGAYYQIFLYDHASATIQQLTDSPYDNIKPRISNDIIFWEGTPDAGSDIFMWRDGEITRLTNNPDDDRNIRTWNGQAVWESFDGNYFQVYHFDGEDVHQLTNTRYDNMQPDIGEGVITWMGYVDNFDAEIFAWTGGPDPIRLTDNDYEDRRPRTAGGRIVWQADDEDASYIFLAEPR